jgi:hypothetical protein
MGEAQKQLAAAVGLDWSKVKKGLERLLTVAEPIARLTPNPYDDIAVRFLRAILSETKNS